MKQFRITGERYTIKEKISFKNYLKEVNDIKPFETPNDEINCAFKASLGDKNALNDLVIKNLKFVISVAKKYSTNDILLEDLINEGNIGLIIAAKKFDPNSGLKFISYAVWWVRKLILAYVTCNSQMIKFPANKINDITKLNKYFNEMEQELCRPVDVQEILDKYDTSLDLSDDEDETNVKDFVKNEGMFLNTLLAYNVDSLDREIKKETNNCKLSDLFSDNMFKTTDHLLLDNDVSNEINNALSLLNSRDRRVIERLFGLNGLEIKTLKEIGDEVGVSREMVRQIKDKTLNKLKSNPRIISVFEEV